VHIFYKKERKTESCGFYDTGGIENEMKTRNLVIRVSNDMYNNLKKIATRKGMTLSEITRYALQRFIDEEEGLKMRIAEKIGKTIAESIINELEDWKQGGAYEYNDTDFIATAEYAIEDECKNVNLTEEEYNELVDATIDIIEKELKANNIEIYYENDIIIRDFRMYNVNERVLLRRKVEDQAE